MADIRVRVSSDPEAEAARVLAASLAQLGGSNRMVRLAIPGGSAMGAVGLVRRSLPAAIWSRVRLTWVDERCVPFDNADSNRGEAYRQRQLDPGEPTALELPLFVDGEEPNAACRRVESAFLRDFEGGLDVVLLGMGPDGHVASLFPGHPALHVEGLVAVVLDSPKPPATRLTLTLPALRSAATVVLLAAGEKKRGALEQLLLGNAGLPATSLERVTIVTDVTLSRPP